MVWLDMRSIFSLSQISFNRKIWVLRNSKNLSEMRIFIHWHWKTKNDWIFAIKKNSEIGGGISNSENLFAYTSLKSKVAILITLKMLPYQSLREKLSSIFAHFVWFFDINLKILKAWDILECQNYYVCMKHQCKLIP